MASEPEKTNEPESEIVNLEVSIYEKKKYKLYMCV